MTTRPVAINFWLYPHATFSEQQTLKDATGALIDLTGYTALMHIRRDRADAAPTLTLTTADGTIVLGGAAGTIQLLLSPSVLAGVPIDIDGETWCHDILLSSAAPTPVVDRIYQGAVFVMPGVTVPP